jgi:predicted phage tail protein
MPFEQDQNIVASNFANQNHAITNSNKLKSIDHGTVVDILAEGQIEGSATASKDGITDKTSTAYKNAFLKDLFLNKTAVLQADADNSDPENSEFNYPKDKIRFDFQDGTANNTVLFAAEEQSFEIVTGDKGQECTFPEGGSATARSATISRTDVDTVQIKVKFDQFFVLDAKKGNRKSTKVEVIIKINPNNGSEFTIISEEVKGKSFNPYSRDYGIDLRNISGYNTNTSGESGSFFPVVVSVQRGNDSGGSRTFNTMRLGEVRGIIRESNNYPNIAYTALRFSSELFPNAPRRFFRIRGKLVKIPHNGTVDLTNGRLTYSGDFNGTFKTDKAWTSDPAWVLYDLLTDSTSGCGLPESELDPFTFYGVSTYCSALVDDGNGGDEPRFSINVNLNNRRDAMAVIRDICSVMRAIPYYEEGTIKVVQDAPKDHANPSALSFDYVFNNGNVIDGNFTYSSTSSKTRFTVINVSYFDLDTQEIDYVTVKDTNAQTKYGTQTKTIRTFGTTSRGMAQRVGKWFLHTQQNQTETVAFETNIAAGSILRIGDILGIADRVKSSVRRGGVVKASTVSKITIDDSSQTNFPSITDSPTISCLLSDGSVETKTINSYTNNTEINVTSDFSSAPVLNSPYILESGTVKAQAFKVVDIREKTKKIFSITAANFNEGKYAAVEDGEALPAKNINIITSILPSPQIIDAADGTKAIQEIIILNNNRPVPKLFIDWESVEGASSYQLIYTKDDENPVVVNTQQSEHEILPSEAGEYLIQIYTINSLGERSASPTEASITTAGLTDPPEDPTGFALEPVGNSQVKLSWDKTQALDVEFGGACEIRHSPQTVDTATFANSNELNTNINGSTTEVILPALTGTYSLKFRDLGGRLSALEAKVELALPEMSDELLVLSQRENPNFSGTKTNLTVSSNVLQLSDPSANLTGSYEFNSVLDFDAVYQNIRLKRHIISEGFNVSDQFDSIGDVDARKNFDGAGSDRVKATLQVQTSQDDSTFTTAQNLFNGSFRARSFKFKSDLISVDVNENVKFSELGFDAFLPSRTENKYISSGNVISSPIQSTTSASGKDIVFANRFFTGNSAIGGSTIAFQPSIAIAPEDLPSGGFYELSAISGTGFTIVFKNSSNAVIDVKFTFQALGYGKGA